VKTTQTNNHEIIEGEGAGIALEDKNVIPIKILKVEQKLPTPTLDSNIFVLAMVKLPGTTNPDRDKIAALAKTMHIGDAYLVQEGYNGF